MKEKQTFRLAVGIATTGRPLILSETLRLLSRQTRLPDIVFVCPADPADFDQSICQEVQYEICSVSACRGLTLQRNAILDVALSANVMIFLDDDFFVHSSYLDEVAYCFSSHHDVVAASGRVVADGVKGPGITLKAATSILAAIRELPQDTDVYDQYNAYGCNMCLRLAPIYANAIRFDEMLPLYGWLEDVDFCCRLKQFGRVVRNDRMIGVHLGVKSGRTSGVRFGYSQIVNPLYMWLKGSTDLRWALNHIARNIAANFRHAWSPEPWIDRRGRVRGNIHAFWDVVRGKIDPRRILGIT